VAASSAMISRQRVCSCVGLSSRRVSAPVTMSSLQSEDVHCCQESAGLPGGEVEGALAVVEGCAEVFCRTRGWQQEWRVLL
jgi:hypothetical protein